MLNAQFIEFMFMGLSLVFFFLILRFFFLQRAVNYLATSPILQKKTNNKNIILITNIFFLKYYQHTSILFLLCNFFFTLEPQIMFNHQFYINSEVINYWSWVVLIFYFFFTLFQKILPIVFFYKLSNDFFFGINILFFFGPLGLFAGTLIVFFFFLEIISSAIFYIILSCRTLFLHSRRKNSGEVFYLNALYVQYWLSFFSSVVFLYSAINIYLGVGTLEWSLLSYLLEVLPSNIILKPVFYLSLGLLLTSVLTKLGLPPITIYKLELYLGLPALSLMWYSFIYFLFSYLYIIIIFFENFSILFLLFSEILQFFVIINTVIFFIISNKYFFLKHFFSVSFIINNLNILYVLITFM